MDLLKLLIKVLRYNEGNPFLNFFFLNIHISCHCIFRDKRGDFELKDFKNPKPDKIIETKSNLTKLLPPSMIVNLKLANL